MCVLLPIDYGCLRVGVLHASMYGNHEQPNNQKRKTGELDLEEGGGEGGGWERKRKGGPQRDDGRAATTWEKGSGQRRRAMQGEVCATTYKKATRS